MLLFSIVTTALYDTSLFDIVGLNGAHIHMPKKKLGFIKEAIGTETFQNLLIYFSCIK